MHMENTAAVPDDEIDAGEIPVQPEVVPFDVTNAVTETPRSAGRVTTIVLFDDADHIQVDVVKLSDPQIAAIWKKNKYNPNKTDADPVRATAVVKDMIRARVKGVRGFSANGKLVFAYPDPQNDAQRTLNETAMMRAADGTPAAFDPSIKEHREMSVKLLYGGKLKFRDEVQNLWNVVLLREQDEEKLVEKN
jgi:hypothetical protein